VTHLISEDSRATPRGGRPSQHPGKPVAVEEIVTQYQRDAVSGNKPPSNDQRLSQPIRSGLLGVPDRDAPLTTVAQQLAKRDASAGVVMTRISRIPASISVVSG
jgi:hypothetical protein